MSNIWHKPEQEPDTDKPILFESKTHGMQFGSYCPVEHYCSRDEFVDPVESDDVIRWLYVKDIDKLQNTLDEVKHLLMQVAYLNMSEHGIGSDRMMIDWCKTVAHEALKQIETFSNKMGEK